MKPTLLVLALLLAAAPAPAQSNDSLVVLFESAPGHRLGFKGSDEELQALRLRLDANGDGTPDLLLRREDADGTLTGMTALDMTTQETIWTLDLTGQDVGLFWGVHPLMVDGEQRLVTVFGNAGAWIFRPEVDDEVLFRLDPAVYQLVGVRDMNNDGSVDLLVRHRERRTVQVWGVDPDA